MSDVDGSIFYQENSYDAYAYDAFGNLTASLKDTGNTIAFKTEEAAAPQNRFFYSGEQYDETAGLYYLRARYYSTDIGVSHRRIPTLATDITCMHMWGIIR